MGNKNNREYLVAISIDKGIIKLIAPDGDIKFYRQRNIDKLDSNTQNKLIKLGYLVPNWSEADELPSNWSISFEDEEIMGKARATFPKVLIDKVRQMR